MKGTGKSVYGVQTSSRVYLGPTVSVEGVLTNVGGGHRLSSVPVDTVDPSLGVRTWSVVPWVRSKQRKTHKSLGHVGAWYRECGWGEDLTGSRDSSDSEIQPGPRSSLGTTILPKTTVLDIK